MNFGSNLKRKRVEKGYTQEQFSELLGVSRQAVSLWESDSGYPEVDKLLEIAKILDVSLDWLFYGIEKHIPQLISSDGKISIYSPLQNVIVRCNTVTVSVQKNCKSNQPEYALIAVDENGKSVFGDVSRTVIGWYKNKADITKETEEINNALCKKQNNYTIKYAVRVKQKGLFLEIVE